MPLKLLPKERKKKNKKKITTSNLGKLQQVKIAEIEMQARILKLEKKLQSARQELLQTRKNEYAKT